MFSFNVKQSGANTEAFLTKMQKLQIERILNKYGQEGVSALAAATPIESGATASAWGYEIVQDGDGYSIHWTNDNINQNVNIAVILQYGHGTGTGGYVAGRDYINPVMAPIFDKIANDAWNEVRNA
jgi:hypothetical protein